MEKAEDQEEKDKAEVQDCLNKLKEQVDSQCNSGMYSEKKKAK